MKHIYILAISFLLSPYLLFAQQTTLFWTTSHLFDSDNYRADIDGSNLTHLTPTNMSGSRSLALDVPNNTLYWADNIKNKIFKANLDGSNPSVWLDLGSDEPLGLDLDLVNNKLYWTSKNFVGTVNYIKRADLDGSNQETVVTLNYASFLENLVVDAPNNTMYWVDRFPDKISKANLDGTGITDIVTGTSGPYCLAVSHSLGKIYWAEYVSVDGFGNATYNIQRCNLDGSNIETLDQVFGSPTQFLLDVPNNTFYWTLRIDINDSRIYKADLEADGAVLFKQETTQANFIDGLTLDDVNSKLYWVGGDIMKRSDTNGANEETLIFTNNSSNGIAVDDSNGKLYWCDKTYGNIKCSNLDGTVEEIIVDGLNNPFEVEVDINNSHIYWTDAGTGKIQRADLDGSNVVDILTGLDQPKGLDLELIFGKIYWAEDGNTNKIKRASLNGVNVEELVTGLSKPSFLEVYFNTVSIYWVEESGQKIQKSSLSGANVTDLLGNAYYGLTLDKTNNKLIWRSSVGIEQADLDGSNRTTLIAGSGGYGIAVGNVAALPVELIDFTGKVIDHTIQLNWQTASELNNEGFDIERLSQTEGWQKIGSVQGNGTASAIQRYTFTDDHPQKGVNYYRLKQVDFDGRFDYSSVVSIDFNPLNNEPSIKVYPNPIVDYLWFDRPISDNIQIWNALGQLVTTLTITEHNKIKLEGLANGMYYLKLVQQQKVIPIQIQH